jgi:hypothetical protein
MGFLRVAVTTAEGTIPVQNALVTIRGADGSEVVLVTDESGLTERIALSAPPAAASQSALSPDPFSVYSVTVDKDGFYRQFTEQVPIFTGISARQPINLIGLAEQGGAALALTGSVDTVTEDPQVLNNGKGGIA